MSSKISLVIITYNRYPFLLRLLRYYQPYLKEWKVVVLDSSSDAVPPDVQVFFDHKNISHHKFDPTIFFANKIALGLKSVSTPFSVLCADDDFIIPTGVKKCVQFLETHSDYTSAHGRYINHQLSKNKRSFFKMRWGPLYERAKSISEITAEKRLIKFFPDNYSGYPVYAVHRTETLQRIWLETTKYVSDWGLSEIFPSCLSLILGKMEIVPILYSSREANTSGWADEATTRSMYSKEKKQKAIDGLVNHLLQVDETDPDIARQIVQSQFGKYFSSAEEKLKKRKIKNCSLSKPEEIAFLKFMIRKILKRIENQFRKALWIWKPLNFSSYKDLQKIKKSVEQSHISSELLDRTRADYTPEAQSGTMHVKEITRK
jgi:glycosyltransferase domain-containing protein